MFTHSVWGKPTHFPILEFLELLEFLEFLKFLEFWRFGALGKAFGFLGNGLWGPGQGPQGSWAIAFRGHERKKGR